MLLCCAMLSRFSWIQLCDPMDRSPPGSSIHEILLAEQNGTRVHLHEEAFARGQIALKLDCGDGCKSSYKFIRI